VINNPFEQLNRLYSKPEMLPGEVSQIDHLSPEDKKLLHRIGLTSVQVQRDLLADSQIFFDRYNLYHHVEKCLQGDTKIRLLDGTSPTIKEMADNSEKYIGKYTFSINPVTLELEPDKIVSTQKTRLNAQLVKVHLDNGKSISCTPDHRFMLRDGTYREAQHLQPEDSLMPLYTKFPSGPLENYLMVYKPKTNNYSFIHRIVAKFLDSTYRTSRGRVPHHIDFNTLNNDPSNIQIMDSTEHKKYHGSICRKKHKPDCSCPPCRLSRGELLIGEDHPAYGKPAWNKDLTKETDPRVAKISQAMLQFFETEEGRLLKIEIGQRSAENLTGGKLSPEHIEKIAIGVKKFFDEGNERVFSDPEAAHKSLSEGQKKRFQDSSEYEKLLEHLKKLHVKNIKSREIRICQASDCDTTFEVLPSSKRKYCGQLCANKDIGKRKDVHQKHSVTQSKMWEDPEYKRTQTEKQQAGRRKKVEERKAQLVECLLNHKVVQVEFLQEREDTYDITTEKNHNFSLDVGIFVHNSLEHPIVGAAAELYANYCCLTGDTKIPLLDGRTLTIREILEEHKEGKENWVYSCDYEGKPQPAKIVNAVKQKHTPKTFRVWLDNGKYVDASDNHKFIKRDGSLCRTDELVVDDSLMPLHRSQTKNGYEIVWNVEEGCWESIHLTDRWVTMIMAQHAAVIKEHHRGRVPSNNHKITKIEDIGEQEVYDIEVDGSHLFGLDAGIYIHNTVFSPMHNATIWITSESPTYQKELTKLLDRIGIEEKIFDWAFTAGSYGDMFVKVDGIPGKGVISIDDSDHPINISRVDHEGVLIGYYKTPVGQSGDQQRLMAPWEYVHFRLLGGKKQRPQAGDQSYAEYRTVHLLTGLRSKQVTTRYGTSVIMNALAIYRRLRLAEDSLLIARLSRGLIRYVWKLKVDSCLKNDTLISLMDGTTPTIQEMAENLDKYIGKYVLTVNEKTRNLEPKQIKNVKKTRLNAQLVKVHIDERGNPEGKSVSCTPDHKFMLRDGTYKEAQYLQPGDSLMPHYHCLSGKGLNGYNLVYDPGTNKYRYEHRVAVGPLKKNQIPHHKDFNKLNNDPSNLKIFESQSEHAKYHHEHNEKYGFAISMPGRPKTEENVQKVVASRRANGKPWHSEETKKVMAEVRTRKIASGDIIPSMTGKHHSKESNEKNSQSHLGITKEVNPNLSGRVGPRSKEDRQKTSRGVKKSLAEKKQKAQLMECLLNHKVISVEWLKEREDTYDIEIDGTPNFPLTAGVFVHNSNMEAVGELIDQYSRVLRAARSMDTREGSPNFDSKENPMASIEDIFIPVWDNVGDLTYDKIGGETDIRWIRDIEDLRQQLAAALRTPLPLLGAWLKEATGPLGSQAIEKVDINFARMARKLQRTVRTGIKRICQIHLAYMNMDPDPNLFDVQMPEMSTAEEESLKESLKDGMEVVSSMMEVVGDIVEGTDKELDRIEIFNYLNEKILKLEDFDLKEYLVAAEEALEEEVPIEEVPEEERPLERKRRERLVGMAKALHETSPMCVKRRERMEHEQKVKELLEKSMLREDKDRVHKKPCLFDTDLHSFVPTQIHTEDGQVNEKVVVKLGRGGGWLGIERCMEKWQSLYGNALIEEKDLDEIVEGEIEGQLDLPFDEKG